MLHEITATRIADQMGKRYPDMKIEVKKGEVFCSQKRLVIDRRDLLAIEKIIGRQTITLGRSGPNFRMIIS